MADIQIKTTSSKSLDGINENNDKVRASSTTSTLMPKSVDGKAQIITKLAQNLSESYQMVKQRQQKYNQISAKIGQENVTPNTTMPRKLLSQQQSTSLDSDGGGSANTSSGGEWQEVCSSKNKLKRKKKLSASLTSVNDSVNQEKRTRIEGIQLNCRGKLHLHEKLAEKPAQATSANTNTNTNKLLPSMDKSAAQKPPLPPITSTTKPTQPQNGVVKVPPPRLKRKLQENVATIQKLNALTEQLRLEINELKSSLTTERGAVRVLRAQNESESRKWKNEVKKLQNSVELWKKNTATSTQNAKKGSETNIENLPNGGGAVGGTMANYEIQRLTNEIIALKEANKASEEKKVINCDADRRKAADMRTLKDSYEIRLTQLTKSAKTEISRLLEEIKTKERNIGQLKKDVQNLQNKNDNKSRNATTNLNTTKQTTNNKPKKGNSAKTKQTNETQAPKKANEEETKKTENQAQDSNELTKLKDIELINNTKNHLQNFNVPQNQNKTTTTATMTKILSNNTTQNLQIKTTDNCENNLKQRPSSTHLNNENNFSNNLLKTATPNTTNTTITGGNMQLQQKEYHSLPHELNQRLLSTTATTNVTPTLATKTHAKQQQNMHEYRAKDNNSDSDSALSSAPPSISPQPPPAGLETADIWQMIRTYTTDIEKLQKDIEILQKENEDLHSELNMAKEQILESEKMAIETANNTKVKQLMARIQCLEDQTHELEAESNELREQNELLEFRIIELEETNDKWSLQSHATPSSNASSTSHTVMAQPMKDVWCCDKSSSKEDPMQMLFGNSLNMDSGITSPHSQHHIDDDLNLMDAANEELRRRINHMIRKSSMDEDDKQCLQQVLSLIQQLDAISQRSGPNSLNTTSCSSDEASSLDMVKSRISDYCSVSSTPSSSSARSTNDSKSSSKSAAHLTNSRIVATVQPYNSSPQHQAQQLHQHQQQQHQSQQQQQQHQQSHTTHSHYSSPQHAPANTPTDSPRKARHSWQTNSLSESGVFVESDFLSYADEHNVCTQTDFEDELVENAHITAHGYKEYACNEAQPFQQRYDAKTSAKVPAAPHLSDQKRLQYYKERLEVLESKVLIYESSGDLQAKRLADRLQHEIQLEKELKELQDRVEYLEGENATLEEEKCEFEEAENDTRLRLQRLEVELEILSQRNIELEMSREALSAKYKDCRSECLILRDDLAASETQIRHLEEDKQKAKENYEFLQNVLPLLLIYNSLVATSQLEQTDEQRTLALAASTNRHKQQHQLEDSMGNAESRLFAGSSPVREQADLFNREEPERTCTCNYLKEEVRCLRLKIKELNARHFEALESADSHWVDLEREYKDRESTYLAKECCLKQKIQKLQDCLRDDSRAANEKICQLEDSENQLKSCLMRVTKEHRDVLEEHQAMIKDYERFKEQYEILKEQQRPLLDALEHEKKRNKVLNDELCFSQKLQGELEKRTVDELEMLRTQMHDLRKEYLYIEVTNSELKEEVVTLEQQIQTMQNAENENLDKLRVLSDEVRTKEEMCQKLEKRLERSEGYSLADELRASPSKRFKREDVHDLKSAAAGLGSVLKSMKDIESCLPTEQQFKSVARDVKRLADTLLLGDEPESEDTKEVSKTENETAEKKTADSSEVQVVGSPTEGEPTQGTPELEVTMSPKRDMEYTSEEVLKPSSPFELQPSGDVQLATDPVSMIVNMALVTSPKIDEDMLPTCSSLCKKKQICEVPSELRKLSATKTVPLKSVENAKKHTTSAGTRRRGSPTQSRQRRRLRRSGRRYTQNLNERVRYIVSCLNARTQEIFNDVSDVDVSQSEVLQRSLSFESFHSVKEEANENSVAADRRKSIAVADAFTETECETREIKKIDKETETPCVQIAESSVQVTDINPEKLLELVPGRTRLFLNMLKASILNTKLDNHAFNLKFLKRWEADKDFREGLEILHIFSTLNVNKDSVSVDNYEHFVSAMSCLHVLEELFRPAKVPIMQQIEDEINEQLMNFHSRRMESEFYCTVYYPVKRPMALLQN